MNFIIYKDKPPINLEFVTYITREDYPEDDKWVIKFHLSNRISTNWTFETLYFRDKHYINIIKDFKIISND